MCVDVCLHFKCVCVCILLCVSLTVCFSIPVNSYLNFSSISNMG